MTRAEAQVDDSKAAALVKPRILVATTTRGRLLKGGCSIIVVDVVHVSRQQQIQLHHLPRELSPAWHSWQG